MCGRYTVRTPAAILADYFGLAPLPGLTPRYNVAPGQDVPSIVERSGDREWRSMRWGLVPYWAKSAAIGYRMINARAESLADKPAFREAYRRRRCLVAADGFYEWQRLDGRTKQPFYITAQDGSPFAFAGLWDRWNDREAGTTLESLAIVTTLPNDIVAPIHDRMPVILEAQDHDAWLHERDDRAVRELLRPLPSEALGTRPVSTLVNRPENDDPRCIEEMRLPTPGRLFD